MKKLFFAFSFIIAVVAAFAFKSSDTNIKSLRPTDVTLYDNIANCPSRICGDYSGAVCTTLFTTPITCTNPYLGNLKRKP